MQALVTGASGFIGHHLCRALLAQGHTVHALARPNSDLRAVPVIRYEIDSSHTSIERAFRAAKPDAVFHLAALVKADHAPADVAPMIEANIAFGAHVLEAMHTSGCKRIINAGTYWEYGPTVEYGPNSLYAATKRAFQAILIHAVNTHAVSATTLVLFDVYGEDDWRPKLLPALIAAAAQGREFPLSPGEQLVPMVHISDVVDGLLHAAATPTPPGHHVYALNPDHTSTLRNTVALLQRQLGKPIPVAWGAERYRTNQIMQPVQTLPRLPGWMPRVPLAEGLRRIINAAQNQA